jgi:hypothetical protein
MKGVMPWLVLGARYTGTKDFCPALDDQVSPVQNMFFLPAHYFTVFICPQRLASWADSRAGSPVS